MTSIADSSIKIQTTSESNPSTPSWFGEVVVISRYLRQQGILSKMNEQVRFARKRFGRYEVIDFLAVLFGYARSSERTLEEFYESLQPFTIPFMAKSRTRPVALPRGTLPFFGGVDGDTR
jgi:hypothetical protein